MREEREALVRQVRRLGELGLLPITAGNVSVRLDAERMLITPSGLDYATIEPTDLAVVRLADASHEGPYAPSSETPLHTGIYRTDADVNAVVHTHSRFATTLACLGWELPPIHYYLTTISPDGRVPVAPYGLYGSAELTANVVGTLRDSGSAACLLANHGAIAVGPSLDRAAARAIVLEEVAMLYHQARQVGEPALLNQDQVAEVADKIVGYRPRRTP